MAHPVYSLKNGKVVPSVTTIISGNLGWNKNHLISWAKSLAKQGKDSDTIVKEAAEIGTITHTLIESRIKDTAIDLKQYKREHLLSARNGFKGFLRWEKEWKPTEYVHTELSLVSEKYKFGGTVDLIARKDKELHLLDNKTTNNLHPEMMIQLAAYKNMYEEVYGEQIKSCSIIKLEKNTPSYMLFPVTDIQIEKGWEAFKCLLRLQSIQDVLEF